MTTQLQAKNRDGERHVYPLHFDGITQMDIEWLIEFAQDNLNVNPSTSAIVRAALSHYKSHLMGQIVDLKNVDDLAEFIGEHRELLFFVSGKGREALKAKYMTTTNNQKD